jgi:hypothetical protein
MFRSKRSVFTLLFLSVFLLFLAVVSLSNGRVSAAPSAVMSTVATGLNHPRGLEFGPNGGLYIAEAGTGGAGPCTILPTGLNVCYGTTGAVVEVLGGVQSDYITGMPSIGDNPLTEALGPHDIAFDENGDMFILIGLGTDPSVLEAGGDLDGLGFAQIVQDDGAGGFTPVVPIGPYEIASNPDGGLLDTNPFALLSSTSGHVVADAGGNSLLQIDAGNTISATAVFPNVMVEFPPGSGMMIPMQAVPTGVVVGPDSAHYISQLTGFPFPVGGASVFRKEAGMPYTVDETGFTNILDVDFDSMGNMYVLEMAAGGLLNAGTDPRGALTKIAPDGTRTLIAMDGLVLPTGMVVGPDDAIYVSNYGVMGGIGEVVRITMAPTSVSLSGFGGDSVPGIFWPLVLLAVVIGLGGAVFGLRLKRVEIE